MAPPGSQSIDPSGFRYDDAIWIAAYWFDPFLFAFRRLYISYVCPYAQRTWITRNYKARSLAGSIRQSFCIIIWKDWILKCIHKCILKGGVHDKFYSICTLGEQGLQEKIKLVPIDLDNKPAWYKEVYPANKVWCTLMSSIWPLPCGASIDLNIGWIGTISGA